MHFSEELLQGYEHEGYICVPDYFSQKEVALIYSGGICERN
jgi:hypothetical protein